MSIPQRKSLPKLNPKNKEKINVDLNAFTVNQETLDSLDTNDKTELMNNINKAKEVALDMSNNIHEDENPIRQTKRWKKLYEQNLPSMGAMRGSKKEISKTYLKMIDRLAQQPPVNQHNIMASFKPFANKDFRYTSDDE